MHSLGVGGLLPKAPRKAAGVSTEGSACCSESPNRRSVVADLLPVTIVQQVGENLLFLDQHGGDVLSYSTTVVAYHPTPTPHLAASSETQEVLHDLQAKGLVARIRSLEDTLVTRRVAVSAGVAVAGGAALFLSLPGAALASSVLRRPGFWVTESAVFDTGLVVRTEQIRIYVWVAKSVFPEISDGDFLTDWRATVDGQNGAADYDNADVWVFWPTLSAGSNLHAIVADFEDGLTAAPTIAGTVSNSTTTIPVLFTHEPLPPEPLPD